MTTRVTNSGLANILLSDLRKSSSDVASLQERMSSGQQIIRPEDDPFGTVRVLQIDEAKSRITQHLRNNTDAAGWLTQTDTALTGMRDLVLRAKQLTIEGGGSVDAQQRNSIADEIDQLTEQVKSEANANWAGSYVFSGTKTNAPPYTAGAVDTYNGDNGVVNRELSDSTTLPVNLTGLAVIGDNTTGLLKNLRTLSADLRANNTNAITSTDVSNMDASLDNLLSLSAIVGAKQNRTEIAASRLDDMSLSLDTARSKLADADVSKLMIQFTTRSTALQAALSSAAKLIQPTLMDYLR